MRTGWILSTKFAVALASLLLGMPVQVTTVESFAVHTTLIHNRWQSGDFSTGTTTWKDPLLPPPHDRQRKRKRTRLDMSSSPRRGSWRPALRRNIKIGLLDVPDLGDNDQPRVILPLPSDHLPGELRDLNVYGMQLTRPVHKLVLEDAVERAAQATTGILQGTPVYGHVAWKPNDHSLVGAIGCVSEIVLQAQGERAAALLLGGGESPQDSERATTVVTAGAFRFIVQQVVQTVPFPVVIVDELPDQEPGTTTTTPTTTPETTIASRTRILNDDEDEDNDDDDLYSDMTPPTMMKELFQLLQSHVDAKVTQAANIKLSPLEQAILQDSSGRDGVAVDNPVTLERVRTQQVAATLIAFRGSILDLCPTPTEGYFALAFLAAEIMDLGNEVRRTMLRMVDGAERLRFVLRHVREAAGMAQARQVAKEITDNNDESSRDLQVGRPELPPWSRQITKGMRIAYYWNEEWEWCEAEVMEDPVMVVDELLITLRFADGEVHRLPFHPDEKARWRPA